MADNYSFGIRSTSLMDNIPGYEGRFNQQPDTSAGSQRLAAEARDYLNTKMPTFRETTPPSVSYGPSDIANRALDQSLAAPGGFVFERKGFGKTTAEDPEPFELAKIAGVSAGALACGAISYLLKSGPMTTYSIIGGGLLLPQLCSDITAFGKSYTRLDKTKYAVATALDTVALAGSFLAAGQIGWKNLGPSVLFGSWNLRSALALNTRILGQNNQRSW